MFVNTGYHADAREKENIKKKRAQKKGKKRKQKTETREDAFSSIEAVTPTVREKGGGKKIWKDLSSSIEAMTSIEAVTSKLEKREKFKKKKKEEKNEKTCLRQ